MDLSAGVADLHLHTTASDGTCSAHARVEQAKERELEAIAITDHDCIDSTRTQRVESSGDLEVITGVEVRGDVSGTKVELLGYYVDPGSSALQSVLEQARAFRRERNRAMVETLDEATTLDLDYDRLADGVDGMLGRPHLAQILLDGGVVASIGEAFDRFLGTDGAAYVPMERVPASDLIDAIHRSGGVASLAHPGRVRSGEILPIVRELVASDMDGIEVWYPYDQAPQSVDYADVGVKDASAIADEYDLVPTGGSDCHGPDSGKYRIGEVRIPASGLDALRTRAADRRGL